MLELTRVSCVVTGRVQGVGFRAFTLGHARRLGLTGWVRNGADGHTVEMTVEGDSEKVVQFLREIEQGPPLANVQRVRTTDLTGHAQFESFSIEH